MRIGLTYDLRDEYLAAGYGEEETAEFDRPDTIEAIEEALISLGHDTDRIGHARQLVQRLAAGDRWDLVFNICEGLHGAGRESQVPAILDLFEIPYTFSDPCVMSICLDKGTTKSVVQRAGVPTPRFAVIESLEQLTGMPALNYPLFAKPIAEGTGKGVTPASRVANPSHLASVCAQLLDRFSQPVLVEEYLPGREFTVGILGTGKQAECLGTLEIVLRDQAEPDVYSYVNKERCEDLVEYRLVQASNDPQVARAEQWALAAWRVLNCRDGGRIDLRCDVSGEPQFMEANPLAGMHPFHSDLPMLATAVGMDYVELIRRLVESAATRRKIRVAGAPALDSLSTAKPHFSRATAPALPESAR
jgi:D-alanine-D-alanine ligase